MSVDSLAGQEKADKKAKGRRNSEGEEKVITMKPLKDAAKELMKLHRRVVNAQTEYREAAKKVAERGGVNTASVNKWIKASAAGKFEDVKRDAEQLSLVLSECGEVSTGAVTGGDTDDLTKH